MASTEDERKPVAPSSDSPVFEQPRYGATSADAIRDIRERSHNVSKPKKVGVGENEMEYLIGNAKELEDELDHLGQSKDKAQMTAASALSLSLIVVLKELLDTGPGASTYYYPNMVLVTLCLVIQVAIGVLAIVLHQLHSRMSLERQKRELLSVQMLGGGETTDGGGDGSRYLASSSVSGAQEKTARCWTGCIETLFGKEEKSAGKETMPLDPHAGGEELSVTAAVKGEGLDRPTALALSLDEPDPGTSTEAIFTNLQQVMLGEYTKTLTELWQTQLKLLAVSSEQEKHEEQMNLKLLQQRLTMIGHQLRMIETRTDIVRRRELYKHMTNIQSAITYLWYITFVLSAFLTGFGILN